MRRMPLLMQFDSVKSMIRNLPSKGTAGLASVLRRVAAKAAPAGHDQRQGFTGQMTDETT